MVARLYHGYDLFLGKTVSLADAGASKPGIIPGNNRAHVLEPEGKGYALDGSDGIDDTPVLIKYTPPLFGLPCGVAVLEWVEHPFCQHLYRYIEK